MPQSKVRVQVVGWEGSGGVHPAEGSPVTTFLWSGDVWQLWSHWHGRSYPKEQEGAQGECGRRHRVAVLGADK